MEMMAPSNWIAIAALALTGMSLYFAHRERLASIRAAFHGKQLDLLKELSQPFGVLCHELPHLFIEVHDQRDEDFVRRASTRIDEAFVKVGELSLLMHSVWPVSLNDIFGDFKAAADELFLYELQIPVGSRTEDEIERLSEELLRAGLAFIHASRNTLGTTPLIGSLAKTGVISKNQARIILKREKGNSPRLTLRDTEEAAREFLEDSQP